MLNLSIDFDKVQATKPFRLSFQVDAEDKDALAKRFEWIRIDRLDGQIILSRLSNEACHMTGKIAAEIVMTCVISDAEVAQSLMIEVDERFAVMDGDDEEAVIDPMSVQTEPMINRTIPVGETVAQLILLEAPDWPRADDVPPVDIVVKSKDDQGPFGKLADLKKTR